MINAAGSQFGRARQAAAARTIADDYGLPLVELTTADVDSLAFGSVPPALLERGPLVPYQIDDGRLKVALADPADVGLIDELRMAAPLPVDLVVASRASLDELLEEFAPKARVAATVAVDSDAPAIAAVDKMIQDALRLRASDVHLLPREGALAVRMRIDGIIRDHDVVSADLALAVVARVKVLAGLDIAEHRAPQDGRFTASGLGQVELRVATLPTVDGEGVVMRLLETSRRAPSLSEIGFSNAMQMTLERIATRASGALLVAGPTGSGKSTTLYATLADLVRSEINVITIEDPVEYRLDGIYQLQVNPRADLTFSRALRSMLRADPDVIMVGEVRDRETAALACEAALTGHFVLTTLHARDAPSALTRLMDMGIEPYLVASAISAVVAQRLARRLCTHCREPYQPTQEQAASVGWQVPPERLFRARGCDRCYRGFSGRIGIFQLLPVTRVIAGHVLRRAAHDELADAALSEGVTTLWADGLAKAASGATTIEELRRVLT
jgi:type IV pilus assembly protein PilB